MATASPAATTAGAPGAERREQLREALELALAAADKDERVGPLIGATRLRMRFEFTDLEVSLNVSAAAGDHNIEWSFADDPGWVPKLVLRMTSEVANRYLQGRESLAIGIARREVRCEGESRIALLYLPATRFLNDSYRAVVERDFPDLVAA